MINFFNLQSKKGAKINTAYNAVHLEARAQPHKIPEVRSARCEVRFSFAVFSPLPTSHFATHFPLRISRPTSHFAFRDPLPTSHFALRIFSHFTKHQRLPNINPTKKMSFMAIRDITKGIKSKVIRKAETKAIKKLSNKLFAKRYKSIMDITPITAEANRQPKEL